MSSNIFNIKTAVTRYLGLKPWVKPTPEQVQDAVRIARERGHRFGAHGRGVAPWMPNKKGFRIARGKYVPRFAHRTA